jgi:stage II sporulation SpoAA-like protein
MLKRLKEKPNGVEVLMADGKVTQSDSEAIVAALLHEARYDGPRMALLCELGPTFKGFTAGAAWQAVRKGWRYLGLFERIAVVSEVVRVRRVARLVGALLPCPVRVFPARESALGWFGSRMTSHLSHRLVPDSGVLVVEPVGPLRPEDFDDVSLVLDPWIMSHGALQGLVVHMRGFPGWESPGGFVRHMQFLREHRRMVRRVAVAGDRHVARPVLKLAERFVKAELKHFGYDELDQAVAWAARRTKQRAGRARHPSHA